MEDWRLRGQEDYLSNATLYMVQFPEFWKCAYETKNPFYQKIAAYANHYVQKTGRWAELLEGEKIQQFWHEHCEFCWEKAYTDKPSDSIAQKICTGGFVANALKIFANCFIGK